MAPPEDPQAGFLKPNVTPPEGDGQVLFTVLPKATLANGTTIQNQARIVFDTNPPIDTPVFTNTIDISNPTTKMVALPKKKGTANFTLKWTGSDANSGLMDVSVYMSDNGGPFTKVLGEIPLPATSATFSGITGHNYRFFSQGRDAARNLEPLKTAAEARTRIVGADLTGAWKTLNVTCSGTGPDLRCRVTGRFQVQNVGTAATRTAGVRFFLSDDAELDSTDTRLGSGSAAPLSPGAKRGVALTNLSLPRGIEATDKFILAVIDKGNTIREAQELNNVVAFGPLP